MDTINIDWANKHNLTLEESLIAPNVHKAMLKRLTEEKLSEFNPEIIAASAVEATLKYFEVARRINEKMAKEYYAPKIEDYIRAKQLMREAWLRGEWDSEAQKGLEHLVNTRFSLDHISFSKYPTLSSYQIKDGFEHFGNFILPEDGKLFATDPCYIHKRKDRNCIDDLTFLGCYINVSDFLKNGYTYLEAWAEINCHRTEKLYLMLPKTNPADVYKSDVIGEVGVDSGTVAFFRLDKVSQDGVILDRFEGESFENWWEMLSFFGRDFTKFYGDYGMSPEMDFVVSGTYSGDGSYNVLELFDGGGVIGYCIDTGYDYEYDEYEDEDDYEDEEYDEEYE